MTKKSKSKLSPRETRLKRLYGLNPGDYEKIFEFQKRVCAICQRPPKEGKNLHVDHRHSDGLTRGLLDWQCNAAIAKFRDNEIRLFSAYKYIENPPATQALGREVFGRVGRITNKRRRKKSKRRNK